MTAESFIQTTMGNLYSSYCEVASLSASNGNSKAQLDPQFRRVIMKLSCSGKQAVVLQPIRPASSFRKDLKRGRKKTENFHLKLTNFLWQGAQNPGCDETTFPTILSIANLLYSSIEYGPKLICR